MTLLAYQQVYSPWAVVIPQAIFMSGAGLVLPQCMAGAMAHFPAMAGSASALFGFIQMAAAAIAGAIVGSLHNGTPLVMAVVISACTGLAMFTYRFLVQRYPAQSFDTGKARA